MCKQILHKYNKIGIFSTPLTRWMVANKAIAFVCHGSVGWKEAQTKCNYTMEKEYTT